MRRAVEELRLLRPPVKPRCDGSRHRRRAGQRVQPTLVLLDALSECGHHRATPRRASSFRKQVRGHSPLLMRMRRPYPPAQTLRSSHEMRTLHRFAGDDDFKGLPLVLRQTCRCALPWPEDFKWDAIHLYTSRAYDPRRVRTASFRRRRRACVEIPKREHVASVALEAGERAREGPWRPCERRKKIVDVVGLLALRISKIQYYVFPDFRIAVNVDADPNQDKTPVESPAYR